MRVSNRETTPAPAAIGALAVDDLRTFGALHHERHLTRAAAALGRSQPATSRALARLRDALGDPLFVRTPAGMAPTARADALAPHVARLLDGLEALTRPAELVPARLRRTFTIAAGDMFEAEVVPRLLGLLAEEAPQVDLALRPTGRDASAEVSAGRLDLLIGPRATMPSDLTVQHLYDDDFVCAAREGHPELGRRLTLADFTRLGHVLIAPRATPGGPVDSALAARGLRRRVVVRTPSFVAGPLIVSRTDLLITGPRRVLASLAAPMRLRLYPLPLPLDRMRIQQAWHPRLTSDPEHAWFRDALRRAAAAR
jgi:DNA-binding transcriptional LysR family regulator